MARRYFNWKLAAVLVLGVLLLGVTAVGLRYWQRGLRTDRALEAGNKAYDEHKWQEAADGLGRYLRANSSDIPILLKYAEVQLKIRPRRQDNIEQAIAAYRSVLRIQKGNYDAAKQLIGMFLSMGMPGEAELVADAQLEQQTELEQTAPAETPSPVLELRHMRALALAGQRDYQQAQEELKDVIDADPNYLPAYETLARLAEQRPQDFDKPATYWLDQAVINNPDSALAYVVRAGYRLRTGGRAAGLDDLERAEKLDLSDSAVRLRLAAEFINVNLLDRAEEHLSKIQESDPELDNLWQISSQLALRSRSPEKMTETAEGGLKALAAQPWDFMPFAAELFIRAGQYDRAADCVVQLREKEVAPPITAFLAGLLADREGRIYDALRSYRRALELGNKSPQVRLALASILTRSGDSRSGLRQLRTLVSENPNLADAHLALARLLARTGNWAQAERHALTARQLAPNAPQPALVHVQARMQSLAATAQPDSSQWQAIDNVLAALLDAAKNGTLEIRLLQLHSAIRQNKFPEAEKLLVQLKEAHPSELRVALAQVELLAAKQENEELISALTGMQEEFPQAAEPVRYLAVVYAQQDDRQKCEATIKDALTRLDRPVASRDLGLLLADYYTRWNQSDKAYELLASLSQKWPADIPIKRRLLRFGRVIENTDLALEFVNDIKSLEGDAGGRWRYEQARVLFPRGDSETARQKFENNYPQIVSLLKENLLNNPDDQDSRMLLAAAYDSGGELRLAVATYNEALDRSPQDVRIIVPTVAALYKANEYERADEILQRAADQGLFHPQLKRLELQGYLRRGELTGAGDILEQLTAEDPDNRSVALSLALIRIRQNNFSEARKLLDTLIAQEPNSTPARAAKIELSLREGNSDEALELCDTIVSTSNDAPAHILRARTYATLGQNRKAEEDFAKAAKIEPNNPGVWLAQSDFYRSLGDNPKALTSIRKAMTLEPDNLAITKQAIPFFLASAEEEIRNEGEHMLEQALASHHSDPELRGHKARLRLYEASLLAAQGTAPAIRQAAEIAQKATEDQPRLSQAWAMLAELSLTSGQLGKAIDITLRGLAYAPNDKRLLLLKAQAEAARSPTLAIPTLMVLYNRDSSDTEVAIRLASTYLAADEPAKAVELLREQLPRCDDSSRRKCRTALAVALYKNGDKEQAQQVFASLSELDPNDIGLLVAQTRVLADDKRWDEINARVTNWLNNNPNSATGAVAVAQELAAIKEDTLAKATAEHILRAILKQNSDSVAAMMLLAVMLQTTDHPDEAAGLYQQALDLQPENLIAINNLAWILCEQQGKPKEALDLAERGLQKAPNYVDLLDTRGVILYRLRRYPEAAEDFNKCIELYLPNAPALTSTHFHLGRTQMELGQNDEAVKSLKKALELNSEIGGLSTADAADIESLLKQLQEGN